MTEAQIFALLEEKGAVSREVAEELAKQYGVEIDKRKITLSDIKSFGTFEGEVKLYAVISAKIYVMVGEE